MPKKKVEVKEPEVRSENVETERRLEEAERRDWYRMVERCDEHAYVHGLQLVRGDEILLRVKGRGTEEILARFVCYNKYWGTMVVEFDDKTMLVKISSIHYLLKKK